MAEFFDRVNEKHAAFITAAPVFFVATSAQGARINLSPKGMDCFRILSETQVAYLDVGGSGNETQAHLNADGRITIMFCAFAQPALILRIYGRGRSVLPQDDGWDELAAHFDLLPGTRQIFVVDVDSLQTSCGWGVPFMIFDRERETLSKAHRNYGPGEYLEKIKTRTRSIDGLPVRLQTKVLDVP
jgi:Pyridoxamine 5'-phosphate oxidase